MLKPAFFLALTFCICTHSILASEYAIIANKKITPLSLSQIKAIYLKKLLIVNNLKVVPVSLKANHPIRQKFEKKILNMNFSRLKSYWNKQHYLGHRPPIILSSQKSAITFIKKVDASLAYVQRDKLVDDLVESDDITILYTWSD